MPKSHQPRHVHGAIDRVIGPILSRTEPQIPVQRRRDGRRVLGPCHDREIRPRIAAHGPVAPGVHLPHRTDGPIRDPFVEHPDLVGGMALVAHLGLHLGRAGRLGQLAHLANRMGQRLLEVDVFAVLEAGHRDHVVRVVGRRDDDPVDVLVFLVQHDAEVFVLPGVRESVEHLGGVLVIDIAQGHEVLGAALLDVVVAHAADADGRQVELVAGPLPRRPGQHVARHNRERRHCAGRAAKKLRAVTPSLLLIHAVYPSSHHPLGCHVHASVDMAPGRSSIILHQCLYGPAFPILLGQDTDSPRAYW